MVTRYVYGPGVPIGRGEEVQFGEVVITPISGGRVVVRAPKEALHSTKDVSTLTNMNKKAEMTDRELEEIRAAAKIGFELAVADVAEIHAEIYGSQRSASGSSKLPSTDSSALTEKPEPR